ncbi:GNAT family N-acetyltransferase [Roseibium aggregatum]|uniref:GNAT family N-acetyltransferase n=1 Tax=Roseibium aggregatum TaxID=187304 RepID=A0A939EEC6_9HYPH|nr:GNAT family N-acetyltransferase [Roseibium aggregatum]MBN9671585.1 GNAT family N-acetyltransferase [Roseibium aggregatum]
MAAGYFIRPAKLEDIGALTDLCMRSKQSNGYDDDFMAQCAEELRVRESWVLEDDFWLAETEGGKVVGCIRLSEDLSAGTGELETCFVDPHWQGARIGRTLFGRLHETARRHGLKRIGLDADPHAEAFYARMGFTTVGRSPSGSIPGRSLPRMELDLSPEDGMERQDT